MNDSMNYGEFYMYDNQLACTVNRRVVKSVIRGRKQYIILFDIQRTSEVYVWQKYNIPND